MTQTAILDSRGNPIEERATFKDPPDWMFDMFCGNRSTAGERVNPKSAMQFITYFACIRNISEDLATLPKRAIQKIGENRTILDDHPVARLMKSPSSAMNRHTFWETITSHALAYHGGFAEILRDGFGNPIEFALMDPTSVTVRQERGRTKYHIGGVAVLDQADVLHVHGLGHDGITGFVISDIGKELLGAALAIQKQRGAYFGNNATISGILETAQKLTPEALERLKKSWIERTSGIENAHKPVILEDGLTWKPMSSEPEKAQMAELTFLTVEEVCRLFRMPPHKVQHLNRAHFSNITDQRIEYTSDTLAPWVSRYEAEIDMKLLRPFERDSGISVKWDLRGKMRGTDQERVTYYKELSYLGVLSPNEIRKLEDLDPYDGGDLRYIQQNLAPTDAMQVLTELIKSGELLPNGGQQPAQKAETPDLAPEPTPEPPAKEEAPQDSLRAFTPILTDAISRVLRAEADKVKRGMKRSNSMEWANAFYEQNDTYVRDALSAPMQGVAIAAGLCDSVIADALTKYCDLHKAYSTHCIIKKKGYTSWEDGTRAAAAADAILTSLREQKETSHAEAA